MLEPKRRNANTTVRGVLKNGYRLLGLEAGLGQRVKAERAPFDTGGFVFTRADGGPYTMNRILKRWHRLAARAGAPLVRFHDLRHTAASLLLLGGTHPKVVSEMLGHSTVAMTLDTYSPVIPAMRSDAAALMNRLLGG